MRLSILAASLVLFPPMTGYAEDEPEPPVVKLSPQVREVERDQAYFDSIDCRRLNEVTARSEREVRYLKRRKQACLDTYRVFIPQR